MPSQATAIGTELQAAIFKRLNTYAELESIVAARIYDEPPDNEKFPYIVIGEEDPTDWTTHTFEGFKGSTTIYAYSRPETKSGKEEVKQIMFLIWLALNNFDLGLPNRSQVNFRSERQFTNKEDDGRTYEGVIIFTFILGGNETE